MTHRLEFVIHYIGNANHTAFSWRLAMVAVVLRWLAYQPTTTVLSWKTGEKGGIRIQGNYIIIPLTCNDWAEKCSIRMVAALLGLEEEEA